MNKWSGIACQRDKCHVDRDNTAINNNLGIRDGHSSCARKIEVTVASAIDGIYAGFEHRSHATVGL